MSDPIISQVVLGIVQPELLIKGAIDAAMQEIRANPWLLDYAFHWYVSDDLTSQVYGEKSRQLAKAFILNNEIFISMGYRVDLPKFPMISIVPKQSNDDWESLGSVNADAYDEVSADDVNFPSLVSLGPFTPVVYDPNTGTVTVPSGMNVEGNVFKGMGYFDKTTNTVFEVLRVLSNNQFTIQPNVKANFINSYVAPMTNFLAVSVERIITKEAFDIFVFGQNTEELMYLDILMRFILYRYKEDFFEGRGYDRTNFTVGPVLLDQKASGGVERFWYRTFTLTGWVHEYWPKRISPKCQGINVNKVHILDPKPTPAGIQEQVENQNWDLSADVGVSDTEDDGSEGSA